MTSAYSPDSKTAQTLARLANVDFSTIDAYAGDKVAGLRSRARLGARHPVATLIRLARNAKVPRSPRRMDERAVAHDANDAHLHVHPLHCRLKRGERLVGRRVPRERERERGRRGGIADARLLHARHTAGGGHDSLAHECAITPVERHEDHLAMRRDRVADDRVVVRRGDLVLDANAARMRHAGCADRGRCCNGHRHLPHRLPFRFSIDCASGSPPLCTSPGEPDSVRPGGSVLPGAAGAGCCSPCGLTFSSAHLKYATNSRMSFSDRFWLGIGTLYLSSSAFASASVCSICSGDLSQRVIH